MKLFFISILLVFISIGLQAQNILNSNDLTTFKTDALTETDISQIQKELKSKGVTIDQLRKQTLSKGMTASEFEKLKNKLISNDFSKPLMDIKDDKIILDDTSQRAKDQIANLIFGSELFQSNSSITSNVNLATPINYELGPNDVIKVILYGIQEFSAELKISLEGNITIPNVGLLKIGGLTIEAATNKIYQQMAKTSYASLSNGESKLSITVSNIRTIHVTVIGVKKPGSYDLSSLSSVFSALSYAGGPSSIGSYRNIELVRNNKIIKKIDLYRFILNGDQSDNIGLKDYDVIRVPVYQKRVEINGQVKRPGIFELKENENFKDLLEFTGGFEAAAFTENIKVIQKNGKDLTIKDLGKKEFSSYLTNAGDVFIVSKILDRYKNRVKITGAVYRPDSYELEDGMRLSDLIKKADGLRDDAYIGSVQIYRLKPNLIKEMVNVNLKNAIAGSSKDNLFLLREDEIYISSVLDLRDSFNIKIFGEVHNPGQFQYSDSMTVKDLIIMAGGSTYAANKKVEVARIYKQEGEKVTNNTISTLISTEMDANLNFTPGNTDIILQPYDVVSITKKVGYAENQIVSITGQIQYAGKYSLVNRLERVSDIINRAGGLIGEAYGKGAFIKRLNLKVDTLSENLKDSLKKENNNNSISSNVQNIALDIDEIMKHPGSYYDLVLTDKDEIIIPKIDNKITIKGGVLRPITITYHDGINIAECISAAGGITENARRNKAYVVYFNGRSKQTKTIGFLRFNPRIEPGSEIVLPEGEKRRDALSSILQYMTIFAQIGTSIATLKLLSK